MIKSNEPLDHPHWKAVKDDWCHADQEAAKKQGWILCASIGLDDKEPPFRLYRDDWAERLLKDDEAAHTKVRKLVAKNDPLGLKAKAFLLKHSKAEHDAVFQAPPSTPDLKLA